VNKSLLSKGHFLINKSEACDEVIKKMIENRKREKDEMQFKFKFDPQISKPQYSIQIFNYPQNHQNHDY